MRFDGLTLLDGSDVQNLTITSGVSFPTVPDLGELFYKTSEGLHVYDGTTWKNIALLLNPTFIGDVTVPNLVVTGSAVATSTELTDAATISWDWIDNQNATVTIDDNRILQNPTNATIGQYCALRVNRTGVFFIII